MSAENPPKPGWLRIGLPNETPQDQIDELVLFVANTKLEGVVYTPGDFSEFGTIIEASLSATGFRIISVSELSPEEKAELDRVEEMFHDFTFDEI